jgi:hypothetical protein
LRRGALEALALAGEACGVDLDLVTALADLGGVQDQVAAHLLDGGLVSAHCAQSFAERVDADQARHLTGAPPAPL